MVYFCVCSIDEVFRRPAVDQGSGLTFVAVFPLDAYPDYQFLFSIVFSGVGYDRSRFFLPCPYSLCNLFFPRVAVAGAYSRGLPFPAGSELCILGSSSGSS